MASATAVAALPAIPWSMAAAGTAPAGELPPPVHCGGCWHPTPGTRWQYQLQGVKAYATTGGINVGITEVPYIGGAAVPPDAFDIDLYVDQSISGNNHTPDSAAVAAIHADGHRAVCYVDAGTWEKWRPDAGAFPRRVLGKHNGWPGERWLDIRATDVLLPIMDARVSACDAAGFDAVEFDNVDGAFNKTGFPLSKQDQLVYNASLANLAHTHALSAGLKNDVDATQIETLLPYFDFAVNEQCFQYGECDVLEPFIAAGKPVFNVEYSGKQSKYCPAMNGEFGFDSSGKKKSLFDEPWKPCR
jgi:hypothetical protein